MCGPHLGEAHGARGQADRRAGQGGVAAGAGLRREHGRGIQPRSATIRAEYFTVRSTGIGPNPVLRRILLSPPGQRASSSLSRPRIVSVRARMVNRAVCARHLGRSAGTLGQDSGKERPNTSDRCGSEPHHVLGGSLVYPARLDLGVVLLLTGVGSRVVLPLARSPEPLSGHKIAERAKAALRQVRG